MLKLCLVGLGNPGTKYNGTRHNIGKEWLLKLSESHCSNFVAKSSIEADIAYSQAEEILWVIPDNYVNNSGRTVSKLLKNINLPNNKIIIFHDDLDFSPTAASAFLKVIHSVSGTSGANHLSRRYALKSSISSVVSSSGL